MCKIIKNALIYTKDYFRDFCCGHDYEHVVRVYKNAKTILRSEPAAENNIVLLSAILHDVDDIKLTHNSKEQSYNNTRNFLQGQDISEIDISKIIDVISTVSMQEYLKGNRPTALEAKIVFDADKLDQIGAIAIARAFAYGAKNNRKIFDVQKFPAPYFDGKYPNGYESTINYIIEVLLNVKSILFTKTAREIAQKRHDFMLKYLNEFLEEEGNINWSDYFFSSTKYWSTGNSSD